MANKLFAVLVPSERHAEHWNHEYAPMFEMLGGIFDQRRRLWTFPLREAIGIFVVRGPRDADQLRGLFLTGFSREGVYDEDVIDVARSLVASR